MPHKRVFAYFDPVTELKKHNTPPIIAAGRLRKVPKKCWASGAVSCGQSSRAEDGRSSRGRPKKTAVKTANLPLNTTNGAAHLFMSQSHNNAHAKLPATAEDAGRKRHSTLSNSREFMDRTENGKLHISSVTRPRANTGPSELGGPGKAELRQRKRSVVEMKSTTGKHSEFATVGLLNQSSNIKRRVNTKTVGNSPEKRSASVPQGRYTQSMAAIVRVRSMAMKWYGGGKTKRAGRQKIKAKNILPTISDSSKFSLCSVSCSPQFAEAIKLMEGERASSSQINRDFHVLCLD